MKMKKTLNGKVALGTITLSLLLSFDAAALECYIGNTVGEGQDIGTLVLLSGTKNGSKVWESNEYVREITCSTRIKENVYFYPFPAIKSQNIPKGVKMGLIYDGKDLGTFDESSGNGNINYKVDTGWYLNSTTAKRRFSIKAYLIKTGEIDTSMTKGPIDLFQLDGKGGLNGAANAKNYRFSLSNWHRTGTVSCSHSYANTAFRLSVGTDQALAASSALSVEPVVNITCNSETAGLANLLSSVTGNLSLTGSAMPNRNDHYRSDRQHFGYAVTHKGTDLNPGKTIPITIPLSGGKANYSIPLRFTPSLAELKLDNPGWIFNEAEKEVKTAITSVFTPLSVNALSEF